MQGCSCPVNPRARLTAMDRQSLGHDVQRAVNCGMGATVSRRDLEMGTLSTGADHRRACYAMGW